MNLYIVVEGRCGERKVYPEWIRFTNAHLTQIYSIGEFTENNYLLISGNGYPNYLSRIDSAIEDMKSKPTIDYLIIAVDSEDLTYEEKMKELTDHITGKIEYEKVKFIIQHPCLEVWALGNRIVCRRNPDDKDLRRYLRYFDVRIMDPELLPPLPEEELNRSQFAFIYLKKMLHDRHPTLAYTKSNPRVICDERYFSRIRMRLEEDNHIKSFSDFLKAFQ